MRGIYIIILLLIIVPFHSCEDEGTCTGIKVARVVAGFYVRDAVEERDTTLSNFTFYSPSRPDSVLYNSTSARKIKFPLPTEDTEEAWFVFQSGSLRDSIRVDRQSRMVLVSYACGFAANHYLDKVSGQDIIIDTVIISYPEVEFYDDENIKIYIKPAIADTTG